MDAEREWITMQRECRQQIAWFGQLALSPGMHRATMLGAPARGGVAVLGSIVGAPNELMGSSDAPRRYLYDPDPSVLASGLLGSLANRHVLSSLGSGGAYLTADALVREPLLQAFEILDCLPLRTKAVAEQLDRLQVGCVEIKKRGVTADPEKFRKCLKLRGDNPATVVLTRIGKKEVALVCTRLPETSGVNEMDAGR
jgi:hypothetical protein